MAGSNDYHQIYDRYQTEGLPKQISIIRFCEQNGVPYKQYERWYKTSRGGRPVPVELVDSDASLGLENQIQDGKLHIDQVPTSSDSERKIQRIEIIFKDGMRIRKTNQWNWMFTDIALIFKTFWVIIKKQICQKSDLDWLSQVMQSRWRIAIGM